MCNNIRTMRNFLRYLLLSLLSSGPKAENSSEFSRFFREASSREKKKVYMEVAHKASADQRRVIESVRNPQPTR